MRLGDVIQVDCGFGGASAGRTSNFQVASCVRLWTTAGMGRTGRWVNDTQYGPGLVVRTVVR